MIICSINSLFYGFISQLNHWILKGKEVEMMNTQTADYFLQIADKFKLGCLLTEQQNPKTIGLSQMAKNDLPKAISMIKGLDIQTMNILLTKIDQLQGLYKEVNDTLQTGGRIFICGCGATGRLSIVLQTLWRQQVKDLSLDQSDKVIAFMAGGDAALIKSIQDFQDHPEFAHQQLVQLGFQENDLLIGSTEGGETSWVIGAIWKSTQLTKRRPYILYGNTDQILCANVQRSRQFIQSQKIIKINCNVGYMALAGSTRMQSTTILMHAIGLTLLGCDKMRKLRYPTLDWKQYATSNIDTFLKYIGQTDFNVIEKLIVHESDIYKNKGNITYQTDQYYAVSILTDTTQRSPTFSIVPFNNKYYPNAKESWCNLKMLYGQPQENILSWEETVERDWRQLLGNRQIRGLNSQYWDKYKEKVPNEVVWGFGLHESRQNKITISHPLNFKVQKGDSQIFSLSLPEYPSTCRLSHHSLLKIILNSLSTIIMGRMDRYYSNIMTYVKPTNYKLIDRAARYIMILRKDSTYEEVVRAIYEIKNKIDYEEPIVLKVIQYLNKVSES